MGKKIQRDPKSVALAQAILEQYKPETKEDVQGAMKDILVIWLNETERKHNWMQIFNELKGRGVEDLLFTYQWMEYQG